MPFNTTNEGVPAYSRPVAPEVPVAPREPQGERIGSTLLGAMVQGALGREKAQIDREQMVQQADIAAKQMSLQQQQMAMTHEYQMGELSAKKMLYQRELANSAIALQGHVTAIGKRVQANMDWHNRTQQQMAFDDKAKKDAGQLNDPSFWASKPILAADKYIEWKGKYGSAAEGEVPKMIKEWDAKADLTKIPIRQGAQWYPGDDKTPAEWKGGEARSVPAWQVFQAWKNQPEARQRIERELAAGGNAANLEQLKANPASSTKPTETWVPGRDQKFDPVINNYIDQAGKGTFLPGKDAVPRELKSKYYKSKPTEAPDYTVPPEDAAPLPDTSYNTPTKTDLTLQHARNALAANPGARDTIMQRLQGMGIDPVHLEA